MPQFTIQDVRTDTVTKGRNSYQVATVVHTTGRGETKEKKVMSFSNPAVFATVSKAQAGDVVQVEYTEGDQYYNWAKVTKVVGDEAPASGSGGKAAPAAGKVVSTYETAEERKIKQLYIIKQSSIGHALEYFKYRGEEDLRVASVLEVAQEFVDYVYGTNETLAQGLDEMDNDI